MDDDKPSWTFLTNHAHVLVCIAEEPDIRGRDIAERVGITERAAQGIIGDLVEAGYVTRTREGRRNRYAVNPEGPLRHPLEHDHTIGDLLSMLGRLAAPSRRRAPGGRCRRSGTFGPMGNQWHLAPDTYLAMVRAEVAAYDELQSAVAAATADLAATRILDLGSGTGVTARAVLDRHPGAALVGVDASDGMLVHARALVPEATFRVQRLEDPLPRGPFDLVISALAVHHLDALDKASLFARVADELRVGGRFVLADVVVPSAPVERPVPLESGVDRPSRLTDQLDWLRAAGLEATVRWQRDDVAVVVADRVV